MRRARPWNQPVLLVTTFLWSSKALPSFDEEVWSYVYVQIPTLSHSRHNQIQWVMTFQASLFAGVSPGLPQRALKS